MSSKPIQKLPKSRKGESWIIENVEHYVSASYINSIPYMSGSYASSVPEEDGMVSESGKPVLNRVQRMSLNYDAYNSQFLESEIQYLTNPFGLAEEDVELPTIPQNVNVLRPTIDLLIGEKIRRPFRYVVLETSPEMTSYMEEYKKSMLMQNMIAQIENQLSGEKKLPEQSFEQINKYIHLTSKNIYERAASLLLSKYRKELNLDTKMVEIWKDSLIAGEGIAFVGDGYDSPIVERINPMHFDFERHPDLSSIEESSWCVRKMYMSTAKILDAFPLTKSQVNKLAEKYDIGATGYGEYDQSYRFQPVEQHDFNHNGDVVAVYHVCWESWDKIGYLKNESNGKLHLDIVDEDYIKQPGDVIEWDWTKTIYQCYKIDDIYTDWGPTDYSTIPYIGNIMNNTNTRNISLVELIRPLQAMYIEIVYRLLLTLARDKGKILNIEITSIPKHFQIDTKKWMHYLSFVGVNFMNQNDEGWDRTRNAPNVSHLSQSDLTMAPVIREYIGLMDKIEDLIGTISGVSKQRQGQIASSELVGNVERSIIQSGTITEHWFAKQNDLEKRVYNAILESTQRLLQEHNNTVMMALDDMSREFLTIPQDYPYKKLNIFISDSNDDMRKLESIRGLAEQALAAGASLGEAAELYISDNIADIIGRLKEVDQRKQQIQEEQAKYQKEIAEMQNATMKELQAEKSRLEDKKIDMASYTAIKVATINQDGQTEMEFPEEENDDIAERKISLDEKKHADEMAAREKEHKDKMEIERKKLTKQKQTVK